MDIQKKITNKNIEKELIEIIKNVYPEIEILDTNQDFLEYFDSLDAIGCIIELEKVFDITIQDEDIEKMFTIKDCCDILSDKYLISTYDRAKKLRKIDENN